MADVSLAITTRLTEHAGTNALIAGRAWVSMLPPDPVIPACLVSKVSAVRTSKFGVDSSKVRGRVQVTAWATSRAGVVALDEQVRAALQRKEGTWGGVLVDHVFVANEAEAYETASRLWRVDRDFIVWWTE